MDKDKYVIVRVGAGVGEYPEQWREYWTGERFSSILADALLYDTYGQAFRETWHLDDSLITSKITCVPLCALGGMN